MIPMVDLGKQFTEIREEIMSVVDQILESSHYILGPKVREFEERVTEYLKVSDALGVASGTDALHLSLEALGIGEGDEVITTPFTFLPRLKPLYIPAQNPCLWTSNQRLLP